MAKLSRVCTAFFALSILVCPCTGQTRFTIQPSDAIHAVGEQATLRCAVSSPFDKTLHWAIGTFDAPTFISSGSTLLDQVDPDRYSVTADNNIFTLRIQNVYQSDGKEYFCAFHTGTDGWMYSTKAELQVIPSWPRPYCSTSPQIAAIGDRVTFSCVHSELNRQLPLTWIYDVHEFGGTEITSADGSYSVQWTMGEADNFGHFTCYAGKPSGHGADCTKIPLKIPPNPVVVPEVRSKLVGQVAEFTCKPSIEIPEVNRYTWMINGTADGYRTFTAEDGRYRLRDGGVRFKIRDLTLSDNLMEVWCKAQNNLGLYAESQIRGIIYVSLIPESTTHLNLSPSKRRPINTDNPGSEATTTITKSQDLNVDPASESNNVGIVVGGTIAGIVLLAVIVVLALYLIKGKDLTKFRPRKGTLEGILSIRVERRRSNMMKRGSTIPSQILLEQQRQSSTVTPEDDTVIYALPLQKGGGTIKVKVKSESQQSLSQDSMVDEEDEPKESRKSYIKAHRIRTATLPAGHRGPTESRSGLQGSPSRVKSLSSASLHSLDSSVANASVGEYVLYSLPLQKGGGTMKVRSRNASMESVSKIAGSSDSLSATRNDDKTNATIQGQDGVITGLSPYDIQGNDIGESEVSPYAEVQGGRDKSNTEESPYVIQGKDFSATDECASAYQDFQGGQTKTETIESPYVIKGKGFSATDESAYAEVQGKNVGKVEESPYADLNYDTTDASQSLLPVEAKGRMSAYANVASNVDEVTYEDVHNVALQTSSKTPDEKVSGYATIGDKVEDESAYADVNVNKGESPYVNMSGGSGSRPSTAIMTSSTHGSDSESEYVMADFTAGGDSFDSVNDELDPKRLNVEGLVYADVHVDVKDGSHDQNDIIGTRDITYADIKELQS